MGASTVCNGSDKSKKFENVATRSVGKLPSTLVAVLAANDPETRTMPIPPLPGGVAIATIVSLVCISRDSSFSRFDLSGYIPLLK